jgi:hypothetical protein
MVQQRGEPHLLIPTGRFPHAPQAARRGVPVLCPARGRLQGVPLGRSPSLHGLRSRGHHAQHGPAGLVRPLHRYYGIVRLPSHGRVGCSAVGLVRPFLAATGRGCGWGLPVPAHGASTHARGLRLRGVEKRLASIVALHVAFPLSGQGRHAEVMISELNTRPACASVNASPAVLPPPAHDSKSGWFATPFLCGSFIRYSMPVSPGAFPDPFCRPNFFWRQYLRILPGCCKRTPQSARTHKIPLGQAVRGFAHKRSA